MTWLLLFAALFDPFAAHDRLLAESTGYFAHAGGTGGQGGDVVYVTHLGDSGAGSMRAALESTETLIVLFEDGLDGTINLIGDIDVESNKTLWGRHRDGSSADILIHPENAKAAFTINNGSQNVIYSNLRADALFGVDDNAPDWIRVAGTGGTVWVDHVTAFGDGTKAMDGFVDVHAGGVTLSWNLVDDWDQVHRLAAEPDTTTVTLHHNLFRNNQGRQPRLSAPDTFAHAFNNWIIDWRGHGMQSINGGELRVDNNIFTAGDDDDAILGDWAGSGNVFEGVAVAVGQSSGIFIPPYQFSLDNPDQYLRDRLMANAGWQSFGAVPEPPSIVLFLLGCLFFQREWYRR